VRRGLVALLAIVAIAGGCKKRELTQNLNVENKVEVRPVTLFFEGPDMLLVREMRNVPLAENPAAALPVVVRELLKGSANAGVPHIFPRDTVVRGAFLLPDGTAFVDLGGPTLTNGWATGSHEELMAVYSVVQTVVTDFPAAGRVRILINGEPAETLAGHVNLEHALTPMPAFVAR
jgi:spore germination protein GerM